MKWKLNSPVANTWSADCYRSIDSTAHQTDWKNQTPKCSFTLPKRRMWHLIRTWWNGFQSSTELFESGYTRKHIIDILVLSSHTYSTTWAFHLIHYFNISIELTITTRIWNNNALLIEKTVFIFHFIYEFANQRTDTLHRRYTRKLIHFRRERRELKHD